MTKIALLKFSTKEYHSCKFKSCKQENIAKKTNRS